MTQKRPTFRFIIKGFHRSLRGHDLLPQDFARMSGLSLLTVKRLKQGLPVSKVSAQRAVDLIIALGKAEGPKEPTITELSQQDLSNLHKRRARSKEYRRASQNTR